MSEEKYQHSWLYINATTGEVCRYCGIRKDDKSIADIVAGECSGLKRSIPMQASYLKAVPPASLRPIVPKMIPLTRVIRPTEPDLDTKFWIHIDEIIGIEEVAFGPQLKLPSIRVKHPYSWDGAKSITVREDLAEIVIAMERGY